LCAIWIGNEETFKKERLNMEIAIELDNYKMNDTLEEDLVGILVNKAEDIEL